MNGEELEGDTLHTDYEYTITDADVQVMYKHGVTVVELEDGKTLALHEEVSDQ